MLFKRPALILIALVALGIASIGCGEEAGSSAESASDTAETGRCDLCGMRIAADSGWRASGQGPDGQALHFDTPKCLFRHHHTRGAVSEPEVVEYYSQEPQAASGLFYVLGSDVEGPMGRDLIPIAGREQADSFLADHHGEHMLSFEEVSAEIAEELFTPRP